MGDSMKLKTNPVALGLVVGVAGLLLLFSLSGEETANQGKSRDQGQKIELQANNLEIYDVHYSVFFPENRYVGKAKNVSDQTLSHVEIGFNFYRQNNVLADSYTVSTNELAPGEVWEFSSQKVRFTYDRVKIYER